LPLKTQAEGGVLYARKIGKSETRIDWSRTAQEVHNHTRGLSPFPGAWCEMEIGGKRERVKLLRSSLTERGVEARCADNVINVVELQRAGGKAMNAADFLRGAAEFRFL